MYTLASKYTTSNLRIPIDFTRSGRNAFDHLNAMLGNAYIRIFQLKRDLAEYIERHIDSGNPMIEEFDVLYEDGICLTIYCSGGTYYIKGITTFGTIIAVQAVLVWTKVKRGCNHLLSQVLAGWRYIIAKADPAAYCL